MIPGLWNEQAGKGVKLGKTRHLKKTAIVSILRS
jgi:hypothetical protein